MSLDQRERQNDFQEALRVALEGLRNNSWSSMPGIVQSYDPVKNVAVVQIAIKDFDGPDGYVAIAPVPDCIGQFPGGGGLTLTFPVGPGTECLLIFANRCVDAWWQLGGVQVPMEVRPNELSDAFALFGTWSLPNVPANISTTSTQLRDVAGTTYVEVTKTGMVNIVTAADVTVTAAGSAVVQAASIALQNVGSALKKLVNETFIALFNAHVHSGGGSGPPTTPADSTHQTSITRAE